MNKLGHLLQLAHNAAANCQADSPVRTSLEECAHARSVGVLLPAYRKLAAHFGTPLTQASNAHPDPTTSPNT